MSHAPLARVLHLEDALRETGPVAVYYDRRGLVAGSAPPRTDFQASNPYSTRDCRFNHPIPSRVRVIKYPIPTRLSTLQIISARLRFSLAISSVLIHTTFMRSKLTLTHTKTGKVTYAVVRTASHDREPRIGMKGYHWGLKPRGL